MWARVDDRKRFVILFMAVITLAWMLVWLWESAPGSRSHGHAHHGGSIHMDGAFLLSFAAGWSVMTIAMMLPASLPLVTMFRTLVGRRPDRAWLVLLLIGGYLGVWLVFGMLGSAGNWSLTGALERSGWLAAHPSTLGAASLVLAGLYQFMPLKYACLDRCRSPLSFIVQHWRGRYAALDAIRLGIHHGLYCVGCCWALMLLMFTVGVGHLGWMLALGLVMAVEKNIPAVRQLGAALGVVLLGCGLALVVLQHAH